MVLQGSFDHLLIPLSKGEQHKHKTIAALKSSVDQINSRRNNIVHQGEFSNASDATALIEQAKGVVESLVRLYEPTFLLKDGKKKWPTGQGTLNFRPFVAPCSVAGRGYS